MNLRNNAMKKFFIIFLLVISQISYGLIKDVVSTIADWFTFDEQNRIELFEHIESMSLTQNPEYFLYFETDFNNDGNKYLWISSSESDLGGSYFFNIYKKDGDRYVLLSDYAVFTPEILAFYGKNFSDEKPHLITYLKISGQEGNILVYKMNGEKLESFVYKTIRPMDEDAELFEKLFPAENSFVKKIPQKDFVNYLNQRGIKSAEMANIEFLAFDLGGRTGVVLLTTNPENTQGAKGWKAFNLRRKDTILNDIGLGALGIDISLDTFIPFEIRNPGWKKLEVFPEGRKIIFSRKYSFIRKINRRKFLITLNRDGLDKMSLSFYQLSFNRICAFDIPDLHVNEIDVTAENREEMQAYEFLKSLDFDYDKDSAYFNYQLYPTKDVVYKGQDITIPKNLDVSSNIYDVKEVSLPPDNKFTKEFLSKWNAVRKKARAKLVKEGNRKIIADSEKNERELGNIENIKSQKQNVKRKPPKRRKF